MAIKYDTVRAEEVVAQTHRVFGKITLTADKTVQQEVLAVLLKSGKEGSPKVKDLLRIAGVAEVEVPSIWRAAQVALLTADAELENKQRLSAAESREAGAKKRRQKNEQEERDAADREAFERWKRSRGKGSNDPDAPQGDPGTS